MHSIVIADTSCLIVFHKIGHLDLLHQVYHPIITTPEVAKEFAEDLPPWIKIQSVKDKKYQTFLSTQVDLGESSALALAEELDNPLLLLDDLKARKLAKKLNLRFTGTLGVLNKAKQLHLIDAIKPLLNALLSTDFRVSEHLINDLLQMNGE